MSISKLQIPDGVRDYTGNVAYAKREIEARLRGLFRTAGFNEVETPAFEYDSIFIGEIGDVRQENMLRFFDTDGKALALRPDFTMPAARVISAAGVREVGAAGEPIRVFYIGDAFGFQYDYGLRQRQFCQAGAELVGEGGALADAEILMLAAQSMETLGIGDYVMDLGHVGVFAGLVQQAGLTPEQSEAMRECIDGKILPELSRMVEGLHLDKALSRALISLPNMYGGPDVLDKAYEQYPYEACRRAIDQAQQAIAALKGSILYDKLTIDLGLLPDMNYYTSTVFRAMVPGLGYQLLSGGRYDNVMGRFGRAMPATGFAMGIGWAIEAMEAQAGLPAIPAPDAIAGAAEGCRQAANRYIWQQRERGRCVINSYADTKEALLAEARQQGIAKAVFFNKNGADEMGAE